MEQFVVQSRFLIRTHMLMYRYKIVHLQCRYIMITNARNMKELYLFTAKLR